MALQLRYEAPNGVKAENAYMYIKALTEVDGDLISLQLHIYYTREAKENNLEPLYTRSYSFVPDVTDTARNYRKQGYEYLKSLEEFVSAIDIYEEGQSD